MDTFETCTVNNGMSSTFSYTCLDKMGTCTGPSGTDTDLKPTTNSWWLQRELVFLFLLIQYWLLFIELQVIGPLNTNYFVQDDTHPLSDLNNKTMSLSLTRTSISQRLKKYHSDDKLIISINKRVKYKFKF